MLGHVVVSQSCVAPHDECLIERHLHRASQQLGHLTSCANQVSVTASTFLILFAPLHLRNKQLFLLSNDLFLH